MNPVSATYPSNATGAQTAKSLDWRIVPFSVSYAVIYNAGASGSVTLDTTLDDVNDPNVTPVWSSSAAIVANAFGVLTAPVQYARLTIGSLAGGTLTLKLLQGEYN